MRRAPATLVRSRRLWSEDARRTSRLRPARDRMRGPSPLAGHAPYGLRVTHAISPRVSSGSRTAEIGGSMQARPTPATRTQSVYCRRFLNLDSAASTPNRIGLLTSITGVSFDDAWDNRASGELDGLPVQFIGRSCLMRNKDATGRAKDRIDAEELRKQNPSK